MITLMFVVGRVVTRDSLIAAGDLRADCPTATDAQLWICAFEAFVRTRVVAKLALTQTEFQVQSAAVPAVIPAKKESTHNPPF